jgi:hypothetical protein
MHIIKFLHLMDLKLHEISLELSNLYAQEPEAIQSFPPANEGWSCELSIVHPPTLMPPES